MGFYPQVLVVNRAEAAACGATSMWRFLGFSSSMYSTENKTARHCTHSCHTHSTFLFHHSFVPQYSRIKCDHFVSFVPR